MTGVVTAKLPPNACCCGRLSAETNMPTPISARLYTASASRKSGGSPWNGTPKARRAAVM